MTGSFNAVDESLSALVDAEHSELDLRRVLQAADSDEVLRKWGSYHKMRSVLRKEDLFCAQSSILEGVRAAIDSDVEFDKVVDKPSRLSSDWLRFVGQTAVAASIAVGVLFGLNRIQLEQAAPSSVAQVADRPAVEDARTESRTRVEPDVPSGFELPPLNARTVSSVPGTRYSSTLTNPLVDHSQSRVGRSEVTVAPEIQEELNRLLMKHAESSAANGSFGVLPLLHVDSISED